MVPADLERPATDTRTRRKVRIVKRRLPPRAALASLIVAAGAAAVAFVTWRMWQQKPEIPVAQRTLSDFLLQYRCERDHAFRAAGQADPLACPICGRPAFPMTRYFCRTHGEFEVLVRFEPDATGEPVMTRLQRWPDGEWTDAEHGVECPTCAEPLIRKRENSLDFSRYRRFDGEGSPRRPATTDRPRPDQSPGPPQGTP